MTLENSSRLNNFGALRLLFAFLVIVSHSPELLDGDRSRELLTQAFGTLSFGSLAVDGFFLISGYLITKSYQRSPTNFDYLWKRVLRIYPGYVVAFSFSLFIIGPLAGGTWSGSGSSPLLGNLWRLALLHPPFLQGVFQGQPYPSLNGSMWTIAYEFRCYLLVLALGAAGILSKRFAVLVGAACLLALSAVNLDQVPWPSHYQVLIGLPGPNAALIGIFGVGACFYLFRDRIRYDARIAVGSAILLVLLMFSPRFATLGVAVFGGYLLFWFTFSVQWAPLTSVGARTDLSYGVYLYAFPIQKILIRLSPTLSPWTVSAATIFIVSGLAWVSWRSVEKPALELRALTRPNAVLRALRYPDRPGNAARAGFAAQPQSRSGEQDLSRVRSQHSGGDAEQG